jgi:hypothetical protein
MHRPKSYLYVNASIPEITVAVSFGMLFYVYQNGYS